ncbi:mitotic spindle assembly checkpoint protein MAD2A [Anopheles nili]|uniref:mitotic spindle assembly checkpoint protein MAD2A n=1 Tax=Anopheles nili TaxID=185578 RepID=UPI00237B2602|nr:mitotic spindle assembly checkpoint protein MAD2A [Anopheles nili]
MTSQAKSITLKGSAKIIHKYLDYSFNSILFQRGIYPAGQFRPEEYNGIPVMITNNDKVREFITNATSRVQDWIMEKKIDKLSMVIYALETQEPMERWDFSIEAEYDDPNLPPSAKPIEKVQAEIRAVMRQITSTISFLPFLEKVCTFDILVHAKQNFVIENNSSNDFQWESKDKIEIKNAQTVSLKSFSTGFDKVNTEVIYKVD